MKIKETCTVLEQEQLMPGIFSMWLQTDKIAGEAKAGQFVSVYTNDGTRLLPRPISLCEIDRENGRLRLVYRVAGGGTAEFSAMKAGETLSLLGPLGNGFPMEETEGKRVLLIGGGIGIPPMLQAAKEAGGQARVVAGYRDFCFLREDIEKAVPMTIATEDGSTGTKGTVIDAIKAEGLEADVIFACGPTPMLRALAAYAKENDIACWVSMEERMACGIGACLACTCKTKEVDAHSNVNNKRICKDGPVFPASELEL